MPGSVSAALSLVVATYLGIASVSKFRNRRVFAEQVADYELVPYRLARGFALAILFAEGGAALLIVPPGSHQVGAALAVVLLGSFIFALGSALHQGRDIACGCFGQSGDFDRVGPSAVARACLLLSAALLS